MLPTTLRRATLPIRASALPSMTMAAASQPYTPRASFSTSQPKPAFPNWLQRVYNKPAPTAQTPPTTTTREPSSTEEPTPQQPRKSTNPTTLKLGTVMSTGRMQKTVTVQEKSLEWDKHIGKYYPKLNTYLVSDPRDSLREGDVVEFSSGARKSRRVNHVVERIVSPFGVSIEDRPAVLSAGEREAIRREKRGRKEERRLEKGRELVRGLGMGEDRVREFERLWREKVESGNLGVGRIKALVEERLALAEKREKKDAGAGGEVLP